MILGFQYSSVQKAITVQYVVVAGGGGGGISTGGSPGGGGGAGGYRSSAIGEGSGREAYNSNLSAELAMSILSGVSIPVSVGAGGPNATIGVDSIFSSITSTGGGRGGGGGGQVGGNGGSGGGAGSNTGANGGTGTTGQGWDGNPAGNAYGGGGGGAGSSSPGGVASYTKGGRGRQTLITGSTLSLAGGGCGGAPDTLGGAGGGSNNVFDTVNPPGGYTPPSGTSIFYGGGTSGYNAAGPASGTANTGGGGGGGNSARPENGAAGGSGIILLKYPSDYTIIIGAGLTGATIPVGENKVTTFTAGAGIISWVTNANAPQITTIGQALDTFTGRAGLIGQYFNGDWRSTISTGNIGTLPLSAPTTYTSIAYGSRADYYGFIAIGYFKPPSTGTYTFYTSSDDGSGVWIGNIASATSGRTTANAVLDNLMGGGQGDTKRSGSTTLTGGVWYPIRIVHEEGGGGDNLTFSWAGPGIAETTSLSTYFKAPMDLSGTNLNNYFA